MASFSVVMPALNEEQSILHAIDDTLAAFDHYRVEGEIVVVNDGSTDKTPTLIGERTAQDHPARARRRRGRAPRRKRRRTERNHP